MSRNMTILVGTVGQGVMRSEDSGDSWRRVGIDQGLHSDALVRTLLASRQLSPNIVRREWICLCCFRGSRTTVRWLNP